MVAVAVGAAVGVFDGERVAVGVGAKVAVGVLVGVGEGGGACSFQPRSGAVPLKEMGVGGTNSPSTAVYWATPASMTGEPACGIRPEKSSSRVPNCPSSPGSGRATKRGFCPNMLPAPSWLCAASVPLL